MEELLQKTQYQIPSLTKGQEIEGVVTEKTGNTLVVDIGAKAEGIVSEEEFSEAKYFIEKIKVGDKIKARVSIPETKEGQILLSLGNAAEEFSWQTIEEAYRQAKEIEVKVEAATRVGLAITAYGIKGFIPNSHLSSKLEKDGSSTVGKTISAKIIEANRNNNRLVLSEKAVTEKEEIAKQEEVLKNIKIGTKFTGKVAKIVNFGAFVKIEREGIPLDGLVHLSEISWEKVADPSDVLSEGDMVEVIVIGKDGQSAQAGKLAFSIKQTQKDPWEQALKKYKKDATVKGQITKTGDFGAVVEIEPGVEALLPLAKIPTDTSLKVGQSMDFFVENINKKSRKITLDLSLKKKPLVYK